MLSEKFLLAVRIFFLVIHIKNNLQEDIDVFDLNFSYHSKDLNSNKDWKKSEEKKNKFEKEQMQPDT